MDRIRGVPHARGYLQHLSRAKRAPQALDARPIVAALPSRPMMWYSLPMDCMVY
jgi:hypothetical protein